jgi:hypothetical protein
VGPLSDDAVVHLISTNFVPVAMDRHKMDHDQGEVGAFYHSAYTQAPQYQGLWLISPDGRVLCKTGRGAGSDNWPKVVLADLQAGLTKFGPVAPRRVQQRNLHPYKGLGIRPGGSVVLAVTTKAVMIGDLRTELTADKTTWQYIDGVALSSAEWSSVAPPNAQAGCQWTLPEDLGRRFCRMLTTDMATFQVQDVSEVRLSGRVASVQDGIAYLSYDGRLIGVRRTKGSDVEQYCAMTLAGGVGAYDVRSRQMLSLTWVWDGRIQSRDLRKSPNPDWNRYGAVVEWRLGNLKAGVSDKADAPRPEAANQLEDSTPEDALRVFLFALAARDEAKLRGVALPDGELDVLLKGPSAQPEEIARLKVQLNEKPIRRLKAGDPVKMPDGETRVIKPDDVREGRVVLWAAGEPLPSRLENVDGHWKVFARPFILARKSADENRRQVRE